MLWARPRKYFKILLEYSSLSSSILSSSPESLSSSVENLFTKFWIRAAMSTYTFFLLGRGWPAITNSVFASAFSQTIFLNNFCEQFSASNFLRTINANNCLCEQFSALTIFPRTISCEQFSHEQFSANHVLCAHGSCLGKWGSHLPKHSHFWGLLL